MGSSSNSHINIFIIYEPCKWQPLFSDNKPGSSLITLQDPPVILIQSHEPIQQAEDDVCELSQPIRQSDTIVINLEDIQDHYDQLIDEAHGLYFELSQNQSAFARYSEDQFCSIVTQCHIFRSEIWTMITGLRDDHHGKRQALDCRHNRLNRDVPLFTNGQ
jgi:hypothetical protein